MTKKNELTERLLSFEVQDKFNRVRADKVLHDECSKLSRNQIQRLFDEGLVWHDNEAIIKSQRLSKGDVIYYTIPPVKKLTLEPVNIPLHILYEDEYIAVINKPSGMVVHPGNGTVAPTLVHALLYHYRESLSSIGGVERPGIVHRLDKDTSGAILIAKTNIAYLELSRMFENRTLKKVYSAVVSGSPTLLSGTIKYPIGRHHSNRVKMSVKHNGRYAHTDWQLEEVFSDKAALLKIHIHTGRTHQIRVHLSHIGHPIIGDTLYGYNPKESNYPIISRILLHARELIFNHPITRHLLKIEAPIPNDILFALNDFRKRFSSQTKT